MLKNSRDAIDELEENLVTSLFNKLDPGPAYSFIEIIDETGTPLPKGSPGEIRTKAARMFSEYLGEPDQTATALRDGWFYPGDTARMEEDGHLILLGRTDHMMNYDGLNIYPAEIETIVSEHPHVTDTAVIPLQHRLHQDVPVCAVVCDTDQELAQDIMQFAVQQLGNRAPRRVFQLPQIPRNASGKLDRAALKNQIAGILQGEWQKRSD